MLAKSLRKYNNRKEEMEKLENHKLDCRESAWRIPPMAKVIRKRPDGQRRDQASRDPLDLLEHLPPNQNLSVLLFYVFHQLF